MSIGNFHRDLKRGKPAEQFAIDYFKKHHAGYKDVSENPAYYKNDIDFIVDGKKYEVKKNIIDAKVGRPGLFFRIELSAGNNQGW